MPRLLTRPDDVPSRPDVPRRPPRVALREPPREPGARRGPALPPKGRTRDALEPDLLDRPPNAEEPRDEPDRPRENEPLERPREPPKFERPREPTLERPRDPLNERDPRDALDPETRPEDRRAPLTERPLERRPPELRPAEERPPERLPTDERPPPRCASRSSAIRPPKKTIAVRRTHRGDFMYILACPAPAVGGSEHPCRLVGVKKSGDGVDDTAPATVHALTHDGSTSDSTGVSYSVRQTKVQSSSGNPAPEARNPHDEHREKDTNREGSNARHETPIGERRPFQRMPRSLTRETKRRVLQDPCAHPYPHRVADCSC